MHRPGRTALVAVAAAVLAGVASAAPGAHSVPVGGGLASEAGSVGVGPVGSASLLADHVVVRDRGIKQLYALDGTLLYARVEWDAVLDGWRPATHRRWVRVVGGRRRAAHAMPTRATAFSIGRDPEGRIVVVAGRLGPDGYITRWWLYDLVRDALRPLRIPCAAGCRVEAVAVWHRRVAYVERCGALRASPVLRLRGRTMRVVGIRAGSSDAPLVLRQRSLAVVQDIQFGDNALWRIVDRGRGCPAYVAGASAESGMWIGVGPSALTWAVAGSNFDGLTYSGLRVFDVELVGRCGASHAVRSVRASLLPRTPIHGVAIDDRTLYYATADAIHRLPLPPRTGRARSIMTAVG